jgi:hypothetical protein
MSSGGTLSTEGYKHISEGYPSGSLISRGFAYGHNTRKAAEAAEASKPGASLLTDSEKTKTKKKRIYGMGKSSGEEKSGTVKKPTLGGE